jgi:serine/threonine-protein kinase PRP4
VQEQNTGADQVSAADYDPSQDRREDEHKRLVTNDAHDVETVEEEEEYEEEEEVDDMFAALTTEKKIVKKVRKVVVSVGTNSVSTQAGPYAYTLRNLLSQRWSP